MAVKVGKVVLNEVLVVTVEAVAEIVVLEEAEVVVAIATNVEVPIKTVTVAAILAALKDLVIE